MWLFAYNLHRPSILYLLGKMEIIFSILIVGLEFDQVFPIIHHKVQAVQNYSKVRETKPKETKYVIRCLTQIYSFVSVSWPVWENLYENGKDKKQGSQPDMEIFLSLECVFTFTLIKFSIFNLLQQWKPRDQSVKQWQRQRTDHQNLKLFFPRLTLFVFRVFPFIIQIVLNIL